MGFLWDLPIKNGDLPNKNGDFIGFYGDFMGFQWNSLLICYIAMEATADRNRWFTWVYLLIAW